MFPIRDTLPSRRAPVITVALILVNIGIFIYQVTLPERHQASMAMLYGIVPARFTNPGWADDVGFPGLSLWPFVTTMFLHGGLLHLIGNMWTLWIFGDNVEDRMGSTRFLVFYLLCGIAAGITHLVTNPFSRIPAIGASGAIAGVLGAYFILFPLARVVVLIPVLFYPLLVEVPAILFGGVWFLLQVMSGTAALGRPESGGGIAWWAHIGGFAAGALLYRRFLKYPPLALPRRARWGS